jgi:hypothetical protein
MLSVGAPRQAIGPNPMAKPLMTVFFDTGW